MADPEEEETSGGDTRVMKAPVAAAHAPGTEAAAGKEEEMPPSEKEGEVMLQRHRKEKKELQGRIQALKKGASKGDKKKKREVAEEICRLEWELGQKHQKERDELCTAVKDCTLHDKLPKDLPAVPNGVDTKTKIQRKREKRAQKGQERKEHMLQAELEAEADAEKSTRTLEARKIHELLKSRGLATHEIQSDGNCMYAAVEHQLSQQGDMISFRSLRQKTADYLQSHPDEFIPFMCSPATDGPMTEIEFAEYCDTIASTEAWGGHLELQALSQVLCRPIEVVQAEGPSIKIGDQQKGLPILLTYHRHAFSLGEHYNSVEPATETVEQLIQL